MAMKKDKNRLPPFVPLTWNLLNSDAYKLLPPSAAKALPYFLGKVKLGHSDPERYSTPFILSYPEAIKLGFSKGTFARCIRDLQDKGFIEWIEKGGLRGKGKGYNRYRLSKKWESYREGKHNTTERILSKRKRQHPMAIYRRESIYGTQDDGENNPYRSNFGNK